jgi:predicted CopG family antitoxin
MTEEKLIRVSKHTWEKLWSMRRPGETFEDVIKRLMKSEAGGS